MSLDALFAEQNRSLSREQDFGVGSEELVPLLVFTIAGTRFAVSVTSVREIVENVQVTPLPVSRRGFEGVLNLRGNLVPILARSNVTASGNDDREKDVKRRRFVILEMPTKDLVALEGSQFRRLECPPGQVPLSTEQRLTVMTLQGEPVQYLQVAGPDGRLLLLDSGEDA